MKNIIIGLCAALVLYGAQAFGCGHDECREEYSIGGTIDGAPVWTAVYKTPCTRSFSDPKWKADEEIFGMGKKDSTLSPELLRDLEESHRKDILSDLKESLLFRDKLLKDLFPAIKPDENLLKYLVSTQIERNEDLLKPIFVPTETTEAETSSAPTALSQTTDK